MRIAVATNNHLTVGRHFSGARYFEVLTIENGEVVARESRQRPASPENRGVRGRYGGPEAGRGRRAAQVVADCDVVIAGEIGSGARAHLECLGVEAVISDPDPIEQAALRSAPAL